MNNPRRVLFATVALFFATGTALGQDVTKVAGGAETHKVVLENAQVRVFDVRVQPGQRVAMHSHPASVVYFLTDTKQKFTYPDGKTEEREFKAGTAIWRDAVTHAAENVATTESHLVHIELKGPATPAKK